MKITAETLCVCGHEHREHNQDEWLECIHTDCPCAGFISQEQYEQLMLAGEELDGGADEFGGTK